MHVFWFETALSCHVELRASGYTEASMVISLLLSYVARPAQSPPSGWMPSDPGRAQAVATKGGERLQNGAIMGTWSFSNGLKLTEYQDLWNHSIAPGVEAFVIVLADGRRIPASSMKLDVGPERRSLNPEPKALQKEAHQAGLSIGATLEDSATGLSIRWQASLRDGEPFIRQSVTLAATKADIDVSRVEMLDMRMPNAERIGTVPGSPATAGHWFFGFEHPMSSIEGVGDELHGFLERKVPLKPGTATTYGSVVGVSPVGQMRRGFQYYVEQVRARPYEPFLHYNSWYDLAFGVKFDEKGCLDRINAFGKALVKDRDVKLRSYLFDDGWDETHTVWEFHSGFPQAFSPLKEAAEQYGAGPGVWLSPWGGYGRARQERLATGKEKGMEIDSQGYALSGPKYYARFHQVCMDFVTKYGVNQFKFDGTGSPDKQFPGSAFGSDFEAAIALISDLRKAKPDLFVNLTTGTWPSPFWTRYADSTWRGGSDHSFAGVGSWRQKWITYRDGDTYNGVVKRGPLYPINSLMLHGLIYADHAEHLMDDPGNDFRGEVRSYFATGTQLQEMYITPSKLTKQNWDDLATSAKWSFANRDVLRDVHWVGGDPLKLEVYGWAAWTPKKAILSLRNPSDQAQSFSIDIASVLELPQGYKGAFSFESAYPDSQIAKLTVEAGKSKVVTLQPFEVLVMEGTPR